MSGMQKENNYIQIAKEISELPFNHLENFLNELSKNISIVASTHAKRQNQRFYLHLKLAALDISDANMEIKKIANIIKKNNGN